MSMNDILSAALSKINNAQNVGKTQVAIAVSSKVLETVLRIMQDNHYVGSTEQVEINAGHSLNVNLISAINKCGAIKPHFTIKVSDFEKFEKRYLPAKDFGIILISTSKGIMTHIEAKQQNLGGRLLAYCY